MKKSIYSSSQILIIAEAGVNHNGDLNTALQLIDVAVHAGADVVKFQTFNSKALVNKFAQKANYQQKTTTQGESQFAMLQKLEMPYEWYEKLIVYCKKRNILFLSTPFDFSSVDFLASLGLGIWKIPSGEITNLPYLRKLGARKEEIILSTGMSTLEEVQKAVDILEKSGTPQKNISILHCTTEYPAPYDEINLRAMQTLRDTFPQCKGVGYSDHSVGIEIPLAAVAMGATIIEKHFTLDRTMEGPDHKASLEPQELHTMVQGIRHIKMALGNGVKKPTPSELSNMMVARKSIVAARNIKKGEIFSVDNISVKRPGDGISPMLWDEVLEKRATQDYEEDAQIVFSSAKENSKCKEK